MQDKPMHGNRTVRRSFLRGLAGMSSVGAAGALAGCTGEDGDGGDGGGGDGMDGDGDGGTDGGDGGGQTTDEPNMITVSSAIPPLGHYRAMFEHLEESGAYEQILGDYGVEEFDVRLTWEDVPLFAAGQIDVGFPGVAEASQLAVEQDLNLTVTGSILKLWMGMQIKIGGEYDLFPNVDSTYTSDQEQQLLDKIKADGNPSATIGLDTWASGSVPIYNWTWPQVFGYEFTQDEWAVATADPNQQPQLLINDQIVMASTTPMHGAADEILDGQLANGVRYLTDWLPENDFPLASLNNIVTRDSFVNENPQPMAGVTELLNEGLRWVHENTSEIKSSEDQQEPWGYEGRQDAVEYVYDHLTAQVEDNWPDLHPSQYISRSCLPESGALSEEFIEGEKEIMNTLADAGQVSSDWEDYITYRIHTEL